MMMMILWILNVDSIQSLDSIHLRKQNTCFYKLFQQINVAKFVNFEKFKTFH